MSSNSNQTATKRSNPSRLFSSGSRNQGRGITSKTIAADIAAFKKNGGHIEVLGNTPFRTHSPVAFRSKATATAARRKSRAAAAKATAKK